MGQVTDNRVIAYIRVSTDKQDCPEAQLASIQQYCERKSLQIVQVFSEVESGKSILIRPQLLAALECLGKTATGLVVYRLDRLSRNLHDITGMVQTHFKRFKLHAVQDEIDPSTADGEFRLHIYGAFAQRERALIADRTKSGLQYRKARGQTYCKRLYGWNVGSGTEMVENPQEQAVIQQILAKKDQHWPLRKIADWLNSTRVKPPIPVFRGKPTVWHASTVLEIIKRNYNVRHQPTN